MLSDKVVGQAIVVTSDGAAVKMDISPFFPRHRVRVRFECLGFSGTSLLEGSDTGLFAGEETVLATTGALTTLTGGIEKSIVLPNYVRHSTTRTAGTVDIDLVSGL